jgi:hypothetical protein
MEGRKADPQASLQIALREEKKAQIQEDKRVVKHEQRTPVTLLPREITAPGRKNLPIWQFSTPCRNKKK